MKSSKQNPECRFDMNLVKLVENFNSEDKCHNYLAELRWPTGVECPRCKVKSISTLKGKRKYDCNACRYQFTVTSGSIFHDTHLPLWKWFLATYLMCESKKSMSANQLKRTLAVSYKTAWYLCHRIRAAMDDAQPKLLNGTVEVDETYVGGKRKHVGRGYRGNKTAIAGAKQRGGDTRLEIIRSIDRKTLHAFIHKHTAPETEAIYTDELASYIGIADADTKHESVNHSAEEWVRGDVHTNGVESVWSLLKRCIIGAYHQISVKHLDAYLNELEHRFNNRNNEFLFRDTLLKLVNAETLTFRELTRAV